LNGESDSGPGKLHCGLDAISNVKLLHDVRHVMLYGSLGAFEAPRDFFVGHAPRHKLEDFLLARSKIMGIIVDDSSDPIAGFNQQSRSEARRHTGFAAKDGSHRLDHLGSAAAFQNVASRTCLQRRRDILLTRVRITDTGLRALEG
jgi:hypothetical protein